MIGAVVVVFGLIVFVGVLTPIHEHPITPATVVHAREMVRFITDALQAYRNEYGSFPTGATTHVAAELFGQNPHHMIFIEKSHNFAGGRLVDPWGTPFSITFPSESNVVVRSAGIDKVFGTTDDVVCDR